MPFMFFFNAFMSFAILQPSPFHPAQPIITPARGAYHMPAQNGTPARERFRAGY